MRLKEMMTREVEAVRPETTVKEAAELMRTFEVGTSRRLNRTPEHSYILRYDPSGMSF